MNGVKRPGMPGHDMDAAEIGSKLCSGSQFQRIEPNNAVGPECVVIGPLVPVGIREDKVCRICCGRIVRKHKNILHSGVPIPPETIYRSRSVVGIETSRVKVKHNWLTHDTHHFGREEVSVEPGVVLNIN